MRRLAIAAAAWLALSGRGGEPVDVPVTTHRLRTYCKACHAVGQLRFIQTENDQELWTYILNTPAPTGGKSWAARILELIDWPSDAAPPASQDKWMPKGGKRLQLAKEVTNGIPTRRVLVATLRHYLR